MHQRSSHMLFTYIHWTLYQVLLVVELPGGLDLYNSPTKLKPSGVPSECAEHHTQKCPGRHNLICEDMEILYNFFLKIFFQNFSRNHRSLFHTAAFSFIVFSLTFIGFLAARLSSFPSLFAS